MLGFLFWVVFISFRFFNSIILLLISLFLFFFTKKGFLQKKPPTFIEAALYTNPTKKSVYASAAAFTSLTLALIFASISLASSGLSCKRVFTDSRPCPNLLLS